MTRLNNQAEYLAGYSDEEYEKYGDTVLMNWRDWRNLREKIVEKQEEVQAGRTVKFCEPEEREQIYTLDWVLQTMDETLP